MGGSYYNPLELFYFIFINKLKSFSVQNREIYVSQSVITTNRYPFEEKAPQQLNDKR